MKLLTTLLLCLATCSYAQVRVTYYGDTLKGDVRTMTEHRYEGMDTITTVYTCDVAKGVVLASFYYTEGRLLGRWQVRYDAQRRVTEARLYTANDLLCQTTTTTTDMQGRVAERRTTDNHCGPCNWLHDILAGTLSNWVLGDYMATKLDRYAYMPGPMVKKITAYYQHGSADTTYETTTYPYGQYDHNAAGAVKKEYDTHGNFIKLTDGGTTMWRVIEYF